MHILSGGGSLAGSPVTARFAPLLFSTVPARPRYHLSGPPLPPAPVLFFFFFAVLANSFTAFLERAMVLNLAVEPRNGWGTGDWHLLILCCD